MNDFGGSVSGVPDRSAGEGRDRSVAQACADQIVGEGGKAIADSGDVTSFADMTQTVQTAIDKYGRLDFVVHSAGIVRYRIFHKMPAEVFGSVLDVHLTGAFNIARAAAPVFRAQGWGSYVFMTSTSGLMGALGQANYAAAKAGMFGPFTVRGPGHEPVRGALDIVAPFAATRITAALADVEGASSDRVRRLMAIGPETVAPVATFLCSEQAEAITGQVFVVRKNEVLLMSQPRPLRSATTPRAGILIRWGLCSHPRSSRPCIRWRAPLSTFPGTRSEMDAELLLSHRFPDVTQAYDEQFTILYALSIGLGGDPLDQRQLPYVYEHALQAFPTMAVVLATPGFWPMQAEFKIDWKRVLHGEQELVVHRPLPPAGSVVGRLQITGIDDKGAAKGALIHTERTLSDASGKLLATLRQTNFARGDGGFGGGNRRRTHNWVRPSRAADHVCELPTATNSALLYRLTGDRNPLHADPAVARAAGFDRPILHGLCTFGVSHMRSCARSAAMTVPAFGSCQGGLCHP